MRTGDKVVITIISVILLISLSVYTAMEYDGNDFQRVSNTSLDEFVCEDKNQTLNAKQQERIKEIRQAIDDSVGLTFGGHDIPSFYVQPRTKHLYRLQSKFSLEDWELLSDMYINGRYSGKHNRNAIFALFAIGGEKAVNMLECKINNVKQMSKFEFDMKYHIKNLFNSQGFQQRVKEIREKEIIND
ncbi:MAG: hypothetical protein LBT96_00205 [Campylobacteraceae bacterium]|jgi:hypothetical protein|nr:hypothetical protein [Campylobacteraceae bacterium]